MRKGEIKEVSDHIQPQRIPATTSQESGNTPWADNAHALPDMNYGLEVSYARYGPQVGQSIIMLRRDRNAVVAYPSLSSPVGPGEEIGKHPSNSGDSNVVEE